MVDVDIKGIISKISGEVVYSRGPSLLAGYVSIGSISGGVQISSGPIIHVSVKNLSGNTIAWAGGAGVNSGAGFILFGGEITPEIRVDNLNDIYAFAQTSGQIVSYIAVSEV